MKSQLRFAAALAFASSAAIACSSGRTTTDSASGAVSGTPSTAASAPNGATPAAATPAAATPAPAQHHSVLAGAAVGAAAGHALGHHAVAGAIAGAVIQHHRNKQPQ
jgi:hypothetical protein